MTSWTYHGGGLEAARAHFGQGERPWIDLSTGINPHPWPVDTIPIDWHRLPEPEALLRLEEAAAHYFGVASAHVCAVPGSEIGLRLVARLIEGAMVAVSPSYGSYGELGASGIARADIAMDGATLLLANPNNPDGHCFDKETVAKLCGDRWLLVDEAFADCHPAISIVDQVAGDRRLIVFRSFGKFFGLAGLRLGFVIAPPDIVEKVRQTLGAWPISSAAIAIGTAAYRDRRWIDGARIRLFAEAERLDASLVKAGFRPIGQCPSFRLIETRDARTLFERFARSAILVRPFADHDHWLRIGLPADDIAFDRLERVLRDG